MVRTLRILVVEDDALIALLLAEMLSEMGHEVCGAASTEEAAVTQAATSRPDLIIMDRLLGSGSGVAAIDRILLAGPMPHVMMSGNAAGRRRPGGVVLAKPFMQRDLACAIQAAVPAEPAG
jgi:CheY-like chemotaxis protein